ncbi:MAG: metallophosphoesterase [Hyphomicrobiales bacterium]|nr:metallophosphoesterase [Hyphomicrobiales bacterium]
MSREAERDLSTYPGMVRWFDPRVLFKVIQGVVLSGWFGRYADHRVTQGALDRVDAERLMSRADLSGKIETDADGAVWIDFVADIGDGFDATYTVAHLLAQESLTLRDGTELPRGAALVIGGDLCYPSASRENYWARMRQPYMLAQPDDERRNAHHPRLFAIPGNHDWYDGLVAFHGTFCRALDEPPFHGGIKIGNWRCKQHRSYFAVKLPHNWWIWGVDIQLSGYIDQPQINYFRLMADKLGDGAKVIICTAMPSWLYAVEYGNTEFHSIEYIAQIARNSNSDYLVKAIVSGDLHHYSRYHASENDPQLITAGGGGAFVHSTHQLKEELEVPDINSDQQTAPTKKFTLGKGGGDCACYPDRETCRLLLWRNLGFAVRNWEFSIGIGVVYWIVSWLFVSHDGGSLFRKWREDAGGEDFNAVGWLGDVFSDIVKTPSLAFIIAGVTMALFFYVDTRRRVRWPIGILHALAHIILFIVLALVFVSFNERVIGLDPEFLGTSIAFALEMIVIGGLLGAAVFGLYLLMASLWLNLHGQDAFSALRIDKYRNFLRLRLSETSLTIYPIGLDEVPRRNQWRPNPEAKDGRPISVFVPDTPLDPFLIEPPIVIDAHVPRRTRKPDTGSAQ